MKVTIRAFLFAKRNMYVNSSHSKETKDKLEITVEISFLIEI